jgi:hypothetical protein
MDTEPCKRRTLVAADVVRSKSHLPPLIGRALAVAAFNARVRLPVVPVAVIAANSASRFPF